MTADRVAYLLLTAFVVAYLLNLTGTAAFLAAALLSLTLVDGRARSDR